MSTVRVVIPVYNRRDYIGEALQSVLDQTHRDFEIVVADDGSADDTVAVVREFAARDSRIRVLRLPHGGVSSARNAALAAPGDYDYAAFLDSDDIWLSTHLERAIGALEAVSGNVYFDAATVADLARLWDEQRLAEYCRKLALPARYASRTIGLQQHLLPATVCRRAFVLEEFWPLTSTVVLRRSAIGRSLVFRPDLTVKEDCELYLSLAARGNDFIFDEHPSVHYRRFGDNLSGMLNSLSSHGVAPLQSCIRFSLSKLHWNLSRSESQAVRREIASQSYLLGQNYSGRLELSGARLAYAQSLRYRVTYMALKGFVFSMLPLFVYLRLKSMRQPA